ncbi:MAG: DUF4258 domain-containing protein [Balneolaceae bacterium]
MKAFLEQIKDLIKSGNIRISEHGYDELSDDDIYISDVLNGVTNSVIVEYYPEYPKGKCILVLQKDGKGQPIHVLWGIPAKHEKPDVLVTAYRPDPERWNSEFTKRNENP